MQTLAQIEEAIEALPAGEVEELSAWLWQRRRATADPASVSGEAKASVRRFFGRFAGGDPDGAINETIDADLAREAAGNAH
jgi:hypothetical protein